MLNIITYAAIAVACVAVVAAFWLYAERVRSDPQSIRDLAAVAATAVAIVALIIIVTVWVFPLQRASVGLVAVCAVLGSAFAELKDTWKDDKQQFSIPRALFRTAQWATLAVAGYIVVQVLGNMD